MIFLRIAFLIAPWCFVWLVAIGCSRQDSVLDEVGAEPFPLSEVVGAEMDEGETDRSGDGMLLRYETMVESHSDPLGLRKGLGEFYQEWGEFAGEAAALHALEQHRTLLPQAFAGWLRNDADAPGRWVLSLVGGGRRERVAWLAAGLLQSLPPDDHRARSEWAARVAGHAGCEELVAEVASSWGKQNPQQALDWLEGLAQGGAPSAAAEKIFSDWAETDPAMASTHLTQMAAGPAKDRAMGLLAKAIYRDDPEIARLWASSIADENLRQITRRLLGETVPAVGDKIPGLLSQAE